QRAQRERDTRLQAQRRMTAREDEAQPVVTWRAVWRCLHDVFLHLPETVPGECHVLVLALTLASPGVNRLAPGRRGDPRAGIGWDPVAWPALECDRERVLQRLLGQIQVMEGRDERGDDSPVLGAKDALDGRVRRVLRLRHGRSPHACGRLVRV